MGLEAQWVKQDPTGSTGVLLISTMEWQKAKEAVAAPRLH